MFSFNERILKNKSTITMPLHWLIGGIAHITIEDSVVLLLGVKPLHNILVLWLLSRGNMISVARRANVVVSGQGSRSRWIWKKAAGA